MRLLYFFSILICFLISCSTENQQKSSLVDKPNFVFLFADDYTFDALHYMGNEHINTPNLDRLAASGVTFTHAYNMGGWHGAICVASRSMIISGTSLWPAQEVERSWQKSNGKEVQGTWGKLLEEAGYDTYMTGKWHVRADVDEVFKYTNDVRPGGMPKDYWVGNDSTWRKVSEAYESGEDLSTVLPLGYNRPLSEQDTSWTADNPIHGGYWEGGTHWSEVVKNNGIDFLNQAGERERPFFMYLAFNAPHDPRQAPKEFLDLYPVENVPLPESWLPEYPYKDSIGNSPLLRDEALGPYPRTPYAIKTHIREYYAIISHLDHQIGEILDALEQSGRLDNTYIFFTGDHGLSVGRHGFLGKQSLFDHSVRVPLIASGPGLPKNQQIDADVYLQDIMPTSLELAGVDKPEHVFFNSFLGLAQGTQQNSFYPAIYGAYMHLQRMIRKDGYKLIVYPKVNKLLLFDLEKDPLEMNDLSDHPDQQQRVQAMFEELITLQQEMQDPAVLDRALLD
jgi:arylsulfatase A-like enzyme